MSQSNVGNAQIYEAGDQRNEPEEKRRDQKPTYDEGQENAHDNNDPKDERSIKNRLASADYQNDDESGKKKTQEQILGESDPTAPAKLHGNEPSKGAKIDAKILDEEEELIKKMDEAKKQKQQAKK